MEQQSKKQHRRSALFWDITQRIVAIPCRRFGTIYRSWPLKMGQIGCPERSVRNCHHTLRNIPAEFRAHLLRSWSLRTRNSGTIWLAKFYITHKQSYGPCICRYSDCLRAGRSGDRIPVKKRFSAPVQTGPEAHPASCTMDTGSFPGVRCGRGRRWPLNHF